MVALKAFFVSLVIWPVVLGAFWLIPAGLVSNGTWEWHRGLWAVSFITLVQAIGASYFAAHKPANNALRERDRVAIKDDKHGWRDPLIDIIGMVYGALFLVFIPFDVFYLHLLPRPSITGSAVGAIISLLGLILMQISVAQHVATPNTEDQSVNRQRIIDTGLYRIIRHPMYLGAWMWLGGAAVWLESFAALIASLGVLGFILVRIEIEETYLRKHLPGYVEYTRRVRHRLLPFVL